MMSAPTEKMVRQSIISSEIFIVTHSIVFCLITGWVWSLVGYESSDRASICLKPSSRTLISILPVIRWSLLNSCHIFADGDYLYPTQDLELAQPSPPPPLTDVFDLWLVIIYTQLFPRFQIGKTSNPLCQVSLICGWWLHQKETKWCWWVAKSTAHPLTKPNNSSSLWKIAWYFSSFLVKGIVFFDSLMFCKLCGKKVNSLDVSRTL